MRVLLTVLPSSDTAATYGPKPQLGAERSATTFPLRLVAKLEIGPNADAADLPRVPDQRPGKLLARLLTERAIEMDQQQYVRPKPETTRSFD